MSQNLSAGSRYEGENSMMSQEQIQNNFLLSKFGSNIPTEVERRAVANRDPTFKQYRDGIYEDMIDNPAGLFDFFMRNNDIFKKINDDDFRVCVTTGLHYQHQIFVGTGLGLAGTAITNFLIWPRVTKFRFTTFRGIVFVAKWFGGGFLGNRIAHYMHPIEDIYRELTIKYNLGYEDFNWAMDIYEHAWRSGKLDQLMEERDKFDWSKVED